MRRSTRLAAAVAFAGVASCGGSSGHAQPWFQTRPLVETDNPLTGGPDPVIGMAVADLTGSGFPSIVLGYLDAFPGAVATHGVLPIEQTMWTVGSLGQEQAIAIGDFVEEAFGFLDAVVTVHGPSGDGVIALQYVPGYAAYFALPMVNLAERPSKIVAGDWDGDGHVDIAVLEPASAQVEVLLGDGAGGFLSVARTIPMPQTGLVPLAILAADVTGDGALDLLVTNGIDGTVSVFRNDDGGHFASVGAFLSASGAQSLAAGDLDGDGDLDLVVAGTIADEVAVLLGNGDGTFAAPVLVPLTADSHPVGIDLADFDGDGDLDFIVALAHEERVQLFLNHGDGTFSAPVLSKYALSGLGISVGAPRQVAAADMTGDGRPDVVVLFGDRVAVLVNVH